MRNFTRWLAPLMVGSMVALAISVQAKEKEEDENSTKNLTVLSKDLGKVLGKGMKSFSKGLGVECKACHVKGKMESDDVAAKEVTRTFFKAVVGEKDAAKRAAALKPVLEALKLEKAKDEAKLWEGIDMFKKQ